ncbi:MAG: pyruvate kinase [Candidatus Competibacteraceae bacterium]|nr:pyruvate kinase [Candidatus Competibacteraceae bacterium]
MKVQSKTKVIATVGPASIDKDIMLKMVKAGVDVFRLNFSHGNRDFQRKLFEQIRSINEEQGFNLAVLADLQGPKMRIGEMQNGEVEIYDGNQIRISTKDGVGTAEKVFIRYDQFAEDVNPGEKVLVDDGKIVLEIVSTNRKDEAIATIINGGKLSSNKGFNLPNTKISLPSLTPKDLEDLEYALSFDVEWIGLSFVRSASDVIELKHLIQSQNKSTKVIAKIEKPEAIEDIDNIIKEADGIMVARGDLGVEIPMQEVPLIQKALVKKCLKASKPIIIATQMMESMIVNYNPTRAEVNDVANSIMDGADAVMLSGETSVGKYPVRVIESVQKIIQNVEGFEGVYNNDFMHITRERFITDAICRAAVELADKTRAKGIITMTFTGYTAFEISSYRPKADIYVFTGNRSILNQLSLIWGVRGFYFDKFVSTDHSIAESSYMLKKSGLVKEGDLLVHTASVPMQEKGQTNMLKLHHI